MLDYNFPPFSVGECKPIRGPGRREIGHGVLAERSLKAVIPPADAVPVHDPPRLRHPGVERLVAAWRPSAAARWRSWTPACRSRDPVAGISIGLVKEKDKLHPPDRHHGRRGPLRRHGLQGRRHAAGHHRHPARPQDRRHQRGDHPRGAGAGAGGPAQILQDDARDAAGPAEGDQPVRAAAAARSRSTRRRSAC